MKKKWGLRAIFCNRENIISVVISGVLALIFGFCSPLHPWVGGGAPTDSSVFKTIALMMEYGYMPYKDSFDHKGPFLYILNWLGNRISNYRGIWVIEIVAIGLTFFMMYKIARLSCGIVASTITTLTVTSLLFIYYAGGNFTEEYAMPCIAIGIYIFLDYLKNDIVSNKRLIVSGICCGIVLLLRPNMISVWIVYCLTIVLVLVSNKRVKDISNLVIWFVVGLAIMIIPTLIWLAANGALDCCFSDYIVFNMKYVATGGERTLFSSRWNAFLSFCSPIYTISVISTIFRLKCKERAINISYLGYLILTVLLMSMSGMSYEHYGMILVPACVYPISIIFSDLEDVGETRTKRTLLLLISIYFVLPPWKDIISTIPSVYESRNTNNYAPITDTVVNRVNEYTDESDLISVYGNWNIVYVLSNRIHATRYSYQYPIGGVMPEIMDEYMSELQQEMPKAIVIQQGHYDENIQEFVDKNDYQLKYSSNEKDPYDSAMVYVRE